MGRPYGRIYTRVVGLPWGSSWYSPDMISQKFSNFIIFHTPTHRTTYNLCGNLRVYIYLPSTRACAEVVHWDTGVPGTLLCLVIEPLRELVRPPSRVNIVIVYASANLSISRIHRYRLQSEIYRYSILYPLPALPSPSPPLRDANFYLYC